MVGGMAITCFHNPEVGREYVLDDSPAPQKRRVLVVGGGPAGLAAAAAAARRGHDVTIREQDQELGGRLRWVERCGRAAELMGSVRWLASELAEMGVKTQTGHRVDAAALAAAAPEVVVLATGARRPRELLPAGDGSVPVVSVEEALSRDLRGRRVVVVDHRGVEDATLAAESLARSGAHITMLTPMAQIGAYIGFTRLREHLLRLYAAGCELQPSTQLIGIDGGHALTRHVHSRRPGMIEADLIVASVPGEPDLSLRPFAGQLGARVLLAGDAMAPRTALHAFREGDAAGREA
jgi:NADPH-dependent 2,4-dienoyl-CoA reductase/sulfur reductase-like enzyme